jgi:proline iminopeptidase
MSTGTKIALALLLLVLTVGGTLFWQAMQQPLYEPGMVRSAEALSAPLEPPAQPEEAGPWQVEPGIELHHFSAGEGRNVLIVHGGPGQPYVEPWPGLEPLTGSYRFHYYDQRGAGRSTRPIDSFSSRNFYQNAQELEQALGLSAQIADVERIRRILGEERLILIGHSFGAFQAALYAAEFPERVEALILVAPAPLLLMPMEGPDLFGTIEDMLPEEMLADYQDWHAQYMDFGSLFERSDDELVALNQAFGRFYVAAMADEGTITDVPQPERPGGWMVHAMYMSMGRKHDYRPAVEAVEAPALILHAAEDFQTEAASRTYVEVLPQARFEVIDGAGHMMFYDRPAEFAEAVGGFLQDVELR